MADLGSPPPASGRVNLQLQVALALGVVGTTLLFVALKSESKEILTSNPISSHPRTYSRMWFRGDDALAGAFRQGTKLNIDYWSSNGSILDSLEVAMPGAVTEEQPWAVDALSSRVAWIVGASVYCQMLPAQSAKLTIAALGTENALRSVSILSDGSIAVPFTDSVVRRWDCATGRPRGESPILIEEPEEAVLEGDYLAVSSPKKRALHLYRFSESGAWTLIEESRLPDPPYQLTIPAPGLMIAKTGVGFRLNAKIRNTPGAVRSILPKGTDLLITGSFDNARVLPGQGEMYVVAKAGPNSLAAASRSHLALSNESGTTLLRVSAENTMSRRGQALSYTSGLFFGAAVLLGLAFLSEGAILGILKRRKRRLGDAAVEKRIPEPPQELVSACASGESVLWAGAGLSVQAEFPDRGTFVTRLLNTACVRTSVPAARIAKLRTLASRGDAERVMESLVLEMSAHRQELLAEFKETFARLATASAAHRILSRIGFAAAITTNYDDLLERIGEAWSRSILHAESDISMESADQPFLLKLYGDLALPQTVLLTRSELRAALDHSKVATFISRLSQLRTLVFVGCSVEGLLADLAMLDLPRKVLSRHYLLTGVGGEKWRRSADELINRYGVEVLGFDEAAIHTALPEFLNELARRVEEVRAQRLRADLVSS